jgi:hypothetical protein
MVTLLRANLETAQALLATTRISPMEVPTETVIEVVPCPDSICHVEGIDQV